jgi:hypothetical protein
MAALIFVFEDELVEACVSVEADRARATKWKRNLRALADRPRSRRLTSSLFDGLTDASFVDSLHLELFPDSKKICAMRIKASGSPTRRDE